MSHIVGTIIEQRTANQTGQQHSWCWILAWDNADFGSVGLRGLELEHDVLLPQLMNGVVAV